MTAGKQRPAILLTSMIVGLVAVTEIVLWFVFRNNEVAASRWLLRTAVPVLTLVGIALGSQILRYAGGLLLLAAGTISLVNFVQGPPRAQVAVTGLLIAGALLQFLAGSMLLLWPPFRHAFEEWRRQDRRVTTARTILLAAIAMAALYYLLSDVIHLVAL
jgi:hypothetical protein